MEPIVEESKSGILVKVFYCDRLLEDNGLVKNIIRRFRIPLEDMHHLNIVIAKIYKMNRMDQSFYNDHCVRLQLWNYENEEWLTVKSQEDWILLYKRVLMLCYNNSKDEKPLKISFSHIKKEKQESRLENVSLNSSNNTKEIKTPSFITRLLDSLRFIRNVKLEDTTESIPKQLERKEDNNRVKEKLKVMTFNIRFDNPLDGINRWKYRSKGVCQRLASYQLDILGLQEALDYQTQDIFNALNTEGQYSCITRGREYDEKTKRFYGEATSVIFNHGKLECLKYGFFWLSETPDKPGSKGWDADCVRILTWCVFKPKSGDKVPFLYMNTHLDHVGIIARWNSVLLIKKRIFLILKSLNIRVERVILTADFNCTINCPEFKEILKPDESKELRLAFCNTRDPDEALSTYTGWFDEANVTIDHILLSDQTQDPYCASYKVITDCLPEKEQLEDVSQEFCKRKMSDHRPVLVTFY
jgi:endonuclease/exonuclease/phosphatase family metal-dependent hydrolase